MFALGVSLPRLLGAALLAFALSTSATALAAGEPTPTQIREAAEAFDRGREAYKNENWVTAGEQFERADSLAGSPTALEYAIRARDKAGQLDRAATLSALVAKRYPEEANLTKIATELLDRARPGLFELTVGCAEPCDLAVGGKIVPGAPDVQRTLYLPAGKQTIRAGFSGERADSTEVEASAGGQGQVAFDAPAAAVATPPPAAGANAAPTLSPAPAANAPKTRSGWSPTVFWVGAGLTAVAAGTTIWSGIDTVNNPGKDRVRAECGVGDTGCALYQEGLSHQRRTNVLIGVTAGVGVATAVVGLFATDWSSGEAAPSDQPARADENPVAKRHQRAVARARIVPWVAIGGGALVGAEGRF